MLSSLDSQKEESILAQQKVSLRQFMNFLEWKKATPPGSLLVKSVYEWRKTFSEALEALGLQRWEFRPYSLRRGGATFWFSKHGSLDTILLQGRWMATRTAKTYLNESLSTLTQINIPSKLLAPFHRVFVNAERHPLASW